MSCCVPNCLSNKRCDKNFSYHAFPSNPVLRKNWETAIFGDDFSMNLRSALVCSKHFISSDFRMNKMRKILRRNAVPTIDIPIRKRLKLLNQNLITPESGEFEMDVLTNSNKNYYSNAVSYGLKITHLKNTLKAKTKQLKRLEESVLTLNKKLEYYEKNIVFQNIKRIIELHENGQGDTRTSFLLNQVKNFDKAKPHWPESILHESAILHAECPAGYKALVERNILQLPSEMTLQRYLKHITSRASMPKKMKQKPEEEACVMNIERIFYSSANEHWRNGRKLKNNMIKVTYQADKNENIRNVDSCNTEQPILYKGINNKPNLNAEVRNYQESPSFERLYDLNTDLEIPTSEGSILLEKHFHGLNVSETSENKIVHSHKDANSAEDSWEQQTNVKMQDHGDIVLSTKSISESNIKIASKDQIENTEEDISYVILL